MQTSLGCFGPNPGIHMFLVSVCLWQRLHFPEPNWIGGFLAFGISAKHGTVARALRRRKVLQGESQSMFLESGLSSTLLVEEAGEARLERAKLAPKASGLPLAYSPKKLTSLAACASERRPVQAHA